MHARQGACSLVCWSVVRVHEPAPRSGGTDTWRRRARRLEVIAPPLSLQETGCLYDHITRADAFVLVYRPCERSGFDQACALFETLVAVLGTRSEPMTLLGNKQGLEPCRQVGVDDVHEA
ncbi:uncharacterized protein LOC144143108 [Haemaphysalis longicornis]